MRSLLIKVVFTEELTKKTYSVYYENFAKTVGSLCPDMRVFSKKAFIRCLYYNLYYIMYAGSINQYKIPHKKLSRDAIELFRLFAGLLQEIYNLHEVASAH